MSMNMVSIRDRVAFRVGHVAVAYKGTVLLWGGHKEYLGFYENYQEYKFPVDELCIYDCRSETWYIRMLTGDIPPKLTSPGAAVLNDALYVFGGFVFCYPIDTEDGENLYKLDLRSMEWHQLNPKGTPPVPCNKMAAWSYGNKVYFFGGFGRSPDFRTTNFEFVRDDETEKAWNNQLVAYNTETDSWEWPATRGKTPHPLAAHACDMSGSEVFIMGGRVMNVRVGGLYSLDMKTMTWSDNLALESPDEPKPEGRSWHTLTFFAPDKAVIYGGWNTGAETLEDCSVMVISREPKKVLSWFPYSMGLGIKSRRCHSAVAVNDFDGNKMVIILGGYIDPEENIPGFILMSFQPKSLLRISVDAVLEAREKTRPFWSELPRNLHDLLVTREACD